jgi:ketosteroid isomerase-like protein
MDGALRGFADALLRAAKTDCTASDRSGGGRCRDVLCRVAALHDALARGDFEGVAAELAPDVELEYFGVHLPGFPRLARGAEAAIELWRAHEAAMRWSALSLESATALGETLILFRRECGSWLGHAHDASVVSHFQLRDGRISRVRARSFPAGVGAT